MNIVIIDDDVLVCNSLNTIISNENINVIGVGHSYDDAINLYDTLKPDILLMDIRIGEKTGIDAAKYILEKEPQAKILFLTTFVDDEYIVKAINLGVKGYILKQDFLNIVPAINLVNLNQCVYGEHIIDKVPSLIKSNDKADFSKFDLDDKYIEIIELIAKGMSNKEIATELFLSEGTVRNYISTIMERLDLKSRTQLVVFYYTNKK